MTTTYHAAHFTEHPQRDTVWPAISAHLAALVPPEAAVLEVGDGYCQWPRFLPYSLRDRRLPMAASLVRACLASPYRPRAGQMLVVATRR